MFKTKLFRMILERENNKLMKTQTAIDELDSSLNEHMTRIMFSFRNIEHLLNQYSRRLDRDHKITVPQLICLQEIVRAGRITLTQLSRLVHLSGGTMVGIIDRLEARGLVVRERDLHDRRRIDLVPTTAGNEIVLRTPLPLQDDLAEALKRMKHDERESLVTTLEKIVTLMKKDETVFEPAVI